MFLNKNYRPIQGFVFYNQGKNLMQFMDTVLFEIKNACVKKIAMDRLNGAY